MISMRLRFNTGACEFQKVASIKSATFSLSEESQQGGDRHCGVTVIHSEDA